MKRFLFFLVFVSAASVANAQGVVQLSTYYPSPFGKYDRIQLVPRAGLTAPPCDPGTMYINSDAGNQLEVCNAAGNAWAPLSAGPWTQLGSDIFATDTTADVGIGTAAPTSRLHVVATQGYTPPGVFLEGTDINVDGGLDGEFMIRNNSASGTQKIFLTGTSGATPVLTVDGVAGRVGIGTTSPSAKLTVVTDNNEDSGWYSYSNTDVSDFDFYIYRARGTSAAPLAVTSANNLGGLNFMGYDGTNFEWGAHISANVDGTPGADDMPGRLEFRTTPDGSNIPATRMVIKNDGNVGIGTATPNNRIQVQDLINFDSTTFLTALGFEAGNANSGDYNTFVGYQAGRVNAAGASNVFIGALSGSWNTTGDGNVFIGAGAGLVNGTGVNNVFLGGSAGNANMDGNSNTFVGFSAGGMNTSGIANTFIGNNAGALNTTGSNNILIGNGVENKTETTNNFLNIGNAIYGDLSTHNIGIGTNAPAEELHIGQAVGNVAIQVGNLGVDDWQLIRSVGDAGITSGAFAFKRTGAGAPALTIGPTGDTEVAGKLSTPGGLVIDTCTGSGADLCPSSPANGQMWLCTDAGPTYCDG